VLEQMNLVENSSVFNESEVIDNSYVLNETSITNNPMIIDNSVKSPVTVNFNAYNEINTSSVNDVDSIMSAFGNKLSEAVALATEGVCF
jgi:hypothetical protein